MLQIEHLSFDVRMMAVRRDSLRHPVLMLPMAEILVITEAPNGGGKSTCQAAHGYQYCDHFRQNYFKRKILQTSPSMNVPRLASDSLSSSPYVLKA